MSKKNYILKYIPNVVLLVFLFLDSFFDVKHKSQQNGKGDGQWQACGVWTQNSDG